MTVAAKTKVTLVPVNCVESLGQSRFRALTAEPWLSLAGVDLPSRGALFEITYIAGTTDPLARPIFRLILNTGRVLDLLGSAPSEGVGVWRGRLPPGTVEIRVSPVCVVGDFTFSIQKIRRLSLKQAISARGRAPIRSFFSGSARLVGLEEEADLNLRFVLGRAEEQDFNSWRTRRHRPPEIASHAPPMVVIIWVAHDMPSVRRTLVSLQEQSSPNWQLVLVAPSPEVVKWLSRQSDDRVKICADVRQSIRDATSPVALVDAGDRFAPNALAAFAAHFVRNPEHSIVYSDDIRHSASGRPQPCFKPDWSSIRQTFFPYVGRAAFLTPALATNIASALADLTPELLVDHAVRSERIRHVGHVARLLVDCARPVRVPDRSPKIFSPPITNPKIGIIVPTRDRADLLKACLMSVLGRSSYQNFELLVVDNDSEEKITGTVLSELKSKDARISVISVPGPFNFSHLCNEGAKAVSGEILIFLNNDTVVVDPKWIEKLLEFALMPDVGAVGAKLLYPSRRVQHAGIVIGMGGVAGHFGEGLAEDAENWLGWNSVPHEASAVTAACMMIERNKFQTVAGFDAENLPIDLNDVDLCLRLNELGLRTICDCRTILLHHQSASRGGMKLQSVYQKERNYFSRRWNIHLRNDYCFNPALSLYDRVEKLG